MVKIRTGVFETNSSSTHTCVLMTTEDYQKWINGESYYVAYPGKNDPWNSIMTENGFLPKDKVQSTEIPLKLWNSTENLADVLQDLDTYADQGYDMEAEDFECESLREEGPEILSEILGELNVYSYDTFMYRCGSENSNGEGLSDKTVRKINGTEIIVLCEIQRD